MYFARKFDPTSPVGLCDQQHYVCCETPCTTTLIINKVHSVSENSGHLRVSGINFVKTTLILVKLGILGTENLHLLLYYIKTLYKISVCSKVPAETITQQQLTAVLDQNNSRCICSSITSHSICQGMMYFSPNAGPGSLPPDLHWSSTLWTMVCLKSSQTSISCRFS